MTDTFSSIENAIGTRFADRIVAGADANRLEGRGGNDTFVFQRGQANGDTVVDFGGNGAAAGDAFEFVGYGPGATFVQIDGTHWQINSGDGFTHETITLQNAAAVHQSDVASGADRMQKQASGSEGTFGFASAQARSQRS